MDLNDALRSNLKKILKRSMKNQRYRKKKERRRKEKEKKKKRRREEEEREKVSVYRGHGTQTPVAVVPSEQNLY